MRDRFKLRKSIARMLQGAARKLVGRRTHDIEGAEGEGVVVGAPTVSFTSTMHDAMYLSLFDGAFLRQ